MKFIVYPVLAQMRDLYDIPIGQERFEKYLKMLQGTTKDDRILPIAGYNPMGKAHVQRLIDELLQLKTEFIIESELTAINHKYATEDPDQTFEVVVNLSDDLGGAWTDRFASHYTNTFDFGPIAKRNFCTPYFWTSDETFSVELIKSRSMQAIYRTIHYLRKGKPVTLEDHVSQELFVNQHVKGDLVQVSLEENHNFYRKHKTSEDYSQIFNFLYGDEASTHLGYCTYGNTGLIRPES